MIKKGVVTNQTPSVVSGRRGTIIVEGEAIKAGEKVPKQLTQPLHKKIPSQEVRK